MSGSEHSPPLARIFWLRCPQHQRTSAGPRPPSHARFPVYQLPSTVLATCGVPEVTEAVKQPKHTRRHPRQQTRAQHVVPQAAPQIYNLPEVTTAPTRGNKNTNKRRDWLGTTTGRCQPGFVHYRKNEEDNKRRDYPTVAPTLAK